MIVRPTTYTSPTIRGLGIHVTFQAIIVLSLTSLGLTEGLRQKNISAGNSPSQTAGNSYNESTHSPSYLEPIESADAVLIRKKEWRWSRYVKKIMNLPSWLDLGLEQRTRFESYDHPWRTSQPLGTPDAQIQQRSRVRVGVTSGLFRLLFEGQDSRVHLDDRNAFVTTGSRNETDILQLHASATFSNLLDMGLRTDLHVGRLTLDIGSRRLIARNDFRNSTNAFDGLHWQVTREQNWRLRTFLVQPVLLNAQQLDESSEHALFWGVYGEAHQIPWFRFNTYYFGLNDQRGSMTPTQRTFSTYGVRLYTPPQAERFDYEIESVWQTGKRGRTRHVAHFQHVNLGFSFKFPWSPRILIHYDYASGDSQRGDSQDTAFDTLFGARRFEYMPTGNFGPFFRTNISSPGWRIIVTPVPGVTAQFKHRLWYLATSRGSFGTSGLRDETGGSGNVLGQDVEVRVQWKISQNLEFEAGYDHWFKGSYFDRLPNSTNLPLGGNQDTDYFYILTKFRL